MRPTFGASTKEVLDRLGLASPKTLFRRRTDYIDTRREAVTRFLEPNIHFRRKSPDTTQLVWDLESTVRAWNTATAITGKEGK